MEAVHCQKSRIASHLEYQLRLGNLQRRSAHGGMPLAAMIFTPQPAYI